MIYTLTEALSSLYPGAHWTCRNHDYEQLDWVDTNIPKPSKATIDAEIARLQAEYDSNEYQRLRAAEYPSIADQLDTIYHDGIDAWKEQINTIKEKYPKG